MGWQLPPELQADPRQHVRSDSLAPGKGKVVRQLPITNDFTVIGVLLCVRCLKEELMAAMSQYFGEAINEGLRRCQAPEGSTGRVLG